MPQRKPLFARVKALLNGDSDEARLWFRTDNLLLGNISPDEMLRRGNAFRLRRFIDRAESLASATDEQVQP